MTDLSSINPEFYQKINTEEINDYLDTAGLSFSKNYYVNFSNKEVIFTYGFQSGTSAKENSFSTIFKNKIIYQYYLDCDTMSPEEFMNYFVKTIFIENWLN
ncbi:MAG: hypothetical protein K2M43_02245 [Mycoplasmoidaceae bacterium]|nr:hypothetical protein [Mycoplasmoidaceae bacterium]